MIPFNHRAVLYRVTESNTTGDPVMTWAQATTPAGTNARPDQSWSGHIMGSPLGEQQAAVRLWFLDAGFTDIRERDVLDITEGPESPTRWRIHSVTKPTKMGATVHHVEVATKHYEGAIA